MGKMCGTAQRCVALVGGTVKRCHRRTRRTESTAMGASSAAFWYTTFEASDVTADLIRLSLSLSTIGIAT